jgi:hypothetical protein
MSPLDSIQALYLVLLAIEDWLKSNGAGGLKEDKSIKDNPPKGYGMSAQRYKKLCDDISAVLSKERRLILKKEWREKNYTKTIGDFASAVTREWLSATETAASRRLEALARKLSD